MSRVKIDLPQTFKFSTLIPVRITDLNYGGHVGNDTILSILHEARMQYLASIGYSELDFGGTGLIMADVAIEFKNEVFYGDTIKASVSPADISRIGFSLYYKLEKETEKPLVLALAKTGMICYNYELKKIASVPEEAKLKLSGE
jgi:acyl-CoA thioester hydrolase